MPPSRNPTFSGLLRPVGVNPKASQYPELESLSGDQVSNHLTLQEACHTQTITTALYIKTSLRFNVALMDAPSTNESASTSPTEWVVSGPFQHIGNNFNDLKMAPFRYPIIPSEQLYLSSSLSIRPLIPTKPICSGPGHSQRQGEQTEIKMMENHFQLAKSS